MDINTSANDLRQTLLAKWHDEHLQLGTFTDQLRNWAYEIGQLGIPRFGQTADRLAQLRSRLIMHFELEDEIGSELSQDQPSTAAEAQAACRQAAHDHAHLLRRLDDLISRLSESEPPFDSWEQATNEINLFIDAMEQHEEQEHASLSWLSPHDDAELS